MNSSLKTIFLFIFTICCIWAFGFVIWQNIRKSHDIETISISDQIHDKIMDSIAQVQADYNNTFDIESDYSFQKYVSDKNVLQNKKYEPSDLVVITWEYLVVKTTKPYLRQSAEYALNELSKVYYKKFGKKIYIKSAYRSYDDQVHLFENWCTTLRCAKIGASEHQLGLAVDMHNATTGWYSQFTTWQMKWLDENAYKYGFINTYSKWPQIDGKMKENRHWRFVGVPFATKLHKKKMSFAERVADNEEWIINN